MKFHEILTKISGTKIGHLHFLDFWLPTQKLIRFQQKNRGEFLQYVAFLWKSHKNYWRQFAEFFRPDMCKGMFGSCLPKDAHVRRTCKFCRSRQELSNEYLLGKATDNLTRISFMQISIIYIRIRCLWKKLFERKIFYKSKTANSWTVTEEKHTASWTSGSRRSMPRDWTWDLGIRCFPVLVLRARRYP